jgi:DNA-directed RNA polymerase specialized sigma24 family protein
MHSSDEFDTFFRTRTPALLRAAYLLTGDRQLAEDLVQESLARTYRAWQTGGTLLSAPKRATPPTWTRRISSWT